MFNQWVDSHGGSVRTLEKVRKIQHEIEGHVDVLRCDAIDDLASLFGPRLDLDPSCRDDMYKVSVIAMTALLETHSYDLSRFTPKTAEAMQYLAALHWSVFEKLKKCSL